MFFADESARGVELELDAGSSGLRMYVNVFSIEVPALPDSPTLAKVSLKICDEEYLYLAHILQGGQRLLLPDEARDTIIEALVDGFPITLSTGRYCSAIPAANFQALYDDLISINAQ